MSLPNNNSKTNNPKYANIDDVVPDDFAQTKPGEEITNYISDVTLSDSDSDQEPNFHSTSHPITAILNKPVGLPRSFPQNSASDSPRRDLAYFYESRSSTSRSAAVLCESVVTTDLFTPDGTKDLAKLLECPICMETVSAPIMGCERGHIVCTNCRTKSEKCPLCQGKYINIRNYLAEELVKKYFARCKYHSIGCKHRFLESEKLSHEQDCDFRPFQCNLVGELHTCKKSLIRYDKFKNHILHGHQLKGATSDYGEWFETATSDGLKLNTDHVNEYAYLECFDKLFLCASEISECQMMWWIYLVGSKTEAVMFECEINITHLEKNITQSWQGPIHSIRVNSKDVFNSGLGLIVTPLNLRPLTTFLPKIKKYEWVVGFHVSKKSNSNVTNIF